MSAARKVLAWEVRNLLRSRWVIGYGLLFAALTDALFRFGGSGDRVVVSLLNMVLLAVPLVSAVFGTLYLYGAREFVELLLAQPVGRKSLFAGLYAGLVLPLAGAFLLGTGIPFVLHAGPGALVRGAAPLLLATGTLLTLAFGALAFVVALRFEDRARGLGAALLTWFAATVLYDGLVLLATALFSRWPLERPLLALMALNPVDLGRVLVLLQVDAAALLGYTGAVFRRALGGPGGTAAALAALLLWVAGPLALGWRGFRRKDF
ncbi:MAG TPA: ABC transporter permease subunit [Gemmatimonadales bacterium]|nr:ABC transporter permease subunit [Gemmatimonadales bacterium]